MADPRISLGRPPPSPTKATRTFSLPSARPLQIRDLNAHVGYDALRRDALGAAPLDTPPPSSPLQDDYEHGKHQRSSSVTVPYSSSPPRSVHSSPHPPSSPVKATRHARPSLPLFSPSIASKVGSTDAHAGLEEIAQDPNGCTHVLYGSYTHALMLGRCKPTGQAHASHAASQDDASQDEILGSKPTQNVFLPNTAKHVSRKHAVLEWLPFSPVSANKTNRTPIGGFVVRILGQNGLIVDGKRRRDGHVLRLEPGKSTIDFFGVKTQFRVHPNAQKPISILEAEAAHNLAGQHVRPPRPSLPSNGSSPLKRPEPMRASSLNGSTQSVAKLLSAKHSAYVKQSTLAHDSELPPSPPSSSPPPMNFNPKARPQATRRSDVGSDEASADHDNDGASEPTSPTLGRGGRAMHLPNMPPIASPSHPPARHNDSGRRLQSLVGNTSDDEILDTSAPRSQHSDAEYESDLTPSPSPSPQLRPQLKAPKDAARPDKNPQKPLTNSQLSMPPPRLPASASTNGNNLTQKDAEALRDALRDRARSCVARIAATYDLEGLLAGAIVFHRTATISASEAVRSVLAGTQGMMRGEMGSAPPGTSNKDSLAHGSVVPGWGADDLLIKRAGMSRSQAADRWTSVARRAWTEQLEIQLQSKPMFGQIQRAGKDAAGNSLEHWYYYNKDGDEDAERAANLGALAKPIRGALKTHKPIFWKKSAYPRSADEEAQSHANDNDSTAARVYATAWKDDREWDLFTDSQIPPVIVSTPSSSLASAAKAQMEPPLPSSKVRSSVGVDEKRIWEETQPEEREKTWDRVGDMDWSSSARSSPAAASQGANKRRKRSALSVARE